MQIEDVMQEIIGICKRNGATTVILFWASRAKGTALERSDIDIAVKGVDDIENPKRRAGRNPHTIYH